LVSPCAQDIPVKANTLFSLQTELALSTEDPRGHSHPVAHLVGLHPAAYFHHLTGYLRARKMRRSNARTRTRAEPHVQMVHTARVYLHQHFRRPRGRSRHLFQFQRLRTTKALKADRAHD